MERQHRKKGESQSGATPSSSAKRMGPARGIGNDLPETKFTTGSSQPRTHSQALRKSPRTPLGSKDDEDDEMLLTGRTPSRDEDSFRTAKPIDLDSTPRPAPGKRKVKSPVSSGGGRSALFKKTQQAAHRRAQATLMSGHKGSGKQRANHDSGQSSQESVTAVRKSRVPTKKKLATPPGVTPIETIDLTGPSKRRGKKKEPLSPNNTLANLSDGAPSSSLPLARFPMDDFKEGKETKSKAANKKSKSRPSVMDELIASIPPAPSPAPSKAVSFPSPPGAASRRQGANSSKKRLSRAGVDDDVDELDVLLQQTPVPRKKQKVSIAREFPVSPPKERETPKTIAQPTPEEHESAFSYTQFFGTKDPSLICPYCDEDLPDDPSDTLRALLRTARKYSRPEPRISNRKGLTAPVERYIEVCQRHQFESIEVPKAHEKGWPTDIDFAGLPQRIMSAEIKSRLLEVALDPTTSLFWKEIQQDVERSGERAVMSARGQFATFNRALPGYYGERGSGIIQQLLFSLFPPETLPYSKFLPLTATDYIQRVLVPETALQLIAKDKACAVDEALETMRQSSMYGMTMFPDLGEEDKIRTEIVEQRARRRRREIEREEAEEATSEADVTVLSEAVSRDGWETSSQISRTSVVSAKSKRSSKQKKLTDFKHDRKTVSSNRSGDVPGAQTSTSSTSKPLRPKPRPKAFIPPSPSASESDKPAANSKMKRSDSYSWLLKSES